MLDQIMKTKIIDLNRRLKNQIEDEILSLFKIMDDLQEIDNANFTSNRENKSLDDLMGVSKSRHKPHAENTLKISEPIIGEFKYLPFNNDIIGFLICDGKTLSTTTYSQLFTRIGCTFGGSGDLFDLPNLLNRTVAFFGTYAGADTVNLSVANILAHNHTGITNNASAYTNTSFLYIQSGSVTNPFIQRVSTTTTDGCYGLTLKTNSADSSINFNTSHNHTFTTDSAGSEAAINIRQPTAYVGKWFIYAGNN